MTGVWVTTLTDGGGCDWYMEVLGVASSREMGKKQAEANNAYNKGQEKLEWEEVALGSSAKATSIYGDGSAHYSVMFWPLDTFIGPS